MIQRVQSIFLLLVAISMIVMNFFPLWEKVDMDKGEKATLGTYELKYERFNEQTSDIEVVSQSGTYYIALLSVIAAALAAYSIFRYDNRLTQIKLGALNSLIIGGTLGVTVYFIFDAETLLLPQQQGNYLPGFYFTAAALFFNALANRFIRRDERLVRSADRIR